MSVFLDQKLKLWVAIICQKMLLSHNQIFNLVAHCLDDLEIPIFLNSYQSIKIKPSNPRVAVPSFLDCVPPFVHHEITCLFGMEKICKTPAWAVAHCLFCLMQYEKNYHMFQSSVNVLGRAADQAYLIVGKLNTEYSPEEKIKEVHPNLPIGVETNYVGFEKNRVKKSKNQLLLSYISHQLHVFQSICSSS